jgi:hypothetical protein
VLLPKIVKNVPMVPFTTWIMNKDWTVDIRFKVNTFYCV